MHADVTSVTSPSPTSDTRTLSSVSGFHLGSQQAMLSSRSVDVAAGDRIPFSLNTTQLCEDATCPLPALSVGGRSCRNVVPVGQTGSIPFGWGTVIHYHSTENEGDGNFKGTSLFKVSPEGGQRLQICQRAGRAVREMGLGCKCPGWGGGGLSRGLFLLNGLLDLDLKPASVFAPQVKTVTSLSWFL